jgi:uncharacterized protein (TIGR02118 family)
MVVEDQSGLRPGPVVVNLATGGKREIPAAVSGARSPLFERSKVPADRLCDMTVKLVVLYTHPDDADAFDKHYLGTHAELAKKLPGLQQFESGRFVVALDGGEQTYYRVAELYFADQGALEAAFGSDEGKATAADYQQIAPPGSRMFVEALDD